MNHPSKVRDAVNKLSTFINLEHAGVRHPDWTDDRNLVDLEQGKWLARTNLTGSAGEGIVVIREESELIDAPLYVKYIKKEKEYRVHVFAGEAIFVQQKKKEREVEQTNDQKLIRNRDNGWVFCLTNDEEVPQALKDEAIKAVAALGLDFGAVDIIIGKQDGLPYVLEVNTAPGIQSPTLLDAYVSAILNWFNRAYYGG